MPNRIAFWRNEPTVRFVNLESFAKGVLAFECIRIPVYLPSHTGMTRAAGGLVWTREDTCSMSLFTRRYSGFGGCSSLVIQACMSGIRIGSTPAHWTH